MNAAPHESHSPREPEHDAGPGGRLRQAREAANLSIHDVGAQLHLDVRTLAALEGDEFDSLPAPAFVRGYMRSYARLLNLPAAPIIEAFDRLELAPPPLVADIAEKPQARSSDVPVRLATYFIVAGLCVLVVLWWQNQHFQPFDFGRIEATDPTLSPAGAGEQPVAAAPAPRYAPGQSSAANITNPDQDTGTVPFENERDTRFDQPGLLASEAAPDAEPGASAIAESAPRESRNAEVPLQAAPGTESREQAAASMASQPEPEMTAPQERPGAEPPSPLAALAETLTPAATSMPAQASLAAVEEPAPPPAPTPPPTPDTALSDPVADDVLAMEFESESWVEVYDRGGARLFYNLVGAGKRVEVRGRGPMDVLLGYAKGVDVTFNGTTFDYTPFFDRGMARFSPGGAPSDTAQPATPAAAKQTHPPETTPRLTGTTPARPQSSSAEAPDPTTEPLRPPDP